MKKILRLTARAGSSRLGLAIIVVALLAVAGGATTLASAAGTTINIVASQQPAANVAATLSTAAQPTYAFYSLTLSTKSSWTHVTLSDSQPVVTGNSSANDAAVVFVGGCPALLTLTPDGGFSCTIDKLSPGGSLTISVVVRTPTSGATLAVNPTVRGDEGSGTPGKTDVFSRPLVWNLTSDTTDAINSYTNPATTTGNATFVTNKQLCGLATCTTKNPQWTQASVPNGLAPLGVVVSLTERNFKNAECPSFVKKANLDCFGQVSSITIGSQGAGGVFDCAPPSNPTTCPNSLTFTVEVSADFLTSKVNLNKAFLFHFPDAGSGYEKVPFCSSNTTDSSGDCTISITQDTTAGDIIWTVKGPGNGSWGGAG